MDKESKNIDTIIRVMSAFMGIRLIKQVLCTILLIFGVEPKFRKILAHTISLLV